jgi:hypothetical protein
MVEKEGVEEALQTLVAEKCPLEEVWGAVDEDVKWGILEPCGTRGTLSTRDGRSRSLGSGRIPYSRNGRLGCPIQWIPACHMVPSEEPRPRPTDRYWKGGLFLRNIGSNSDASTVL